MAGRNTAAPWWQKGEQEFELVDSKGKKSKVKGTWKEVSQKAQKSSQKVRAVQGPGHGSWTVIEGSGKLSAQTIRDQHGNPFGPRRGLEGPFKFQTGRVLYYDIREKGGRYWDPLVDMYLPRNQDPATYNGMPRYAADEGGEDEGKSKGKPGGKMIEFLKEVGDKTVKNPDTGNIVKLKSLKGEKGKKMLNDMFKKWLADQDKKKDDKKKERQKRFDDETKKEEAEIDKQMKKLIDKVGPEKAHKLLGLPGKPPKDTRSDRQKEDAKIRNFVREHGEDELKKRLRLAHQKVSADVALRKQIIRLAHANPDLRPHLLPILKEEKASGAKEASRGWHGKVVRYPRGVMVGPSNPMHEGPEDLEIDRSGFYVWEDTGSGGPFGRWSLLGPFSSKSKAEEKSRSLGKWASQNPALPTKEASATRLAMEFLFSQIDRKALLSIQRDLKKAGDEQSAKLLNDLQREMIRQLEVSDSFERAYNRLAGLASRGGSWDPSLLRNNIFKIANELGMKLPSGMF